MPEQTFDFETTLQYSSPARGGWSIVRMAMQVPQSYQLFVCLLYTSNFRIRPVCFHKRTGKQCVCNVREQDDDTVGDFRRAFQNVLV